MSTPQGTTNTEHPTRTPLNHVVATAVLEAIYNQHCTHNELEPCLEFNALSVDDVHYLCHIFGIPIGTVLSRVQELLD